MAKPGILVGISDIKEINPLIKEGATEFYTGLCLSEKIRFPNFRNDNETGNLKNTQELKKTATLCHKHKKKLYLAVNLPIYQPNLHKNIAQTLIELLDTSVDGFIIVDFYLMYELSKQLSQAKRETKIHLSSLASCYNKMTLNFYKQFGVSRILFPQHLYSHEASDFFDDPDIETEIFYHTCINCRYISGRCNIGRSALYPERKIIKYFPCFYKFNILNWPDVKDIEGIYSRWVTVTVNGYSNFYDSVKKGITSIKLGSRGMPLSTKILLLIGAKRAIELVYKAKDKKSFLEEVENDTKIRKDDFYLRSGKVFRYY
ncbi:MAG: U32 family peptidase [Candidatus Omnitrophota bacterium]